MLSPHKISVYITYSDDEVTKNMPTGLNSQMQRLAEHSGVIVLYHSIAQHFPRALGTTLHNVSVAQLSKHLLDLSDYFQFVSLDEFSQAESKAGLASITFDDGYKNVLEQAMPLLTSLNYPFTVFLNPISFEKRWNWRDKVRYLIYHNLFGDFINQHQHALTFRTGRFYRYSKNPANNSANLDFAMDQFLAGKVIDIYDQYPYLSAADLVDHPLVSYGNHSQNHYVLASLDDHQQMQEIRLAHENLSKIRGLNISECFSAPFGGYNDINSITRNIISEMPYSSILMSRQLVQPGKSLANKVQILERFMPRSDDVIHELVSASSI